MRVSALALFFALTACSPMPAPSDAHASPSDAPIGRCDPQCIASCNEGVLGCVNWDPAPPDPSLCDGCFARCEAGGEVGGEPVCDPSDPSLGTCPDDGTPSCYRAL